jgi:hypothetical protein
MSQDYDVFPQVLFDSMNYWPDVTYDDFVKFNSKYYVQALDNRSLSLIIRQARIGVQYEYSDYTSMLSYLNIPIYVFKDFLPIGPQTEDPTLRGTAVYIPKVGLLIVDNMITIDVINHELIHAYQQMMMVTNRLPIYQTIKIKNQILSRIINWFNPGNLNSNQAHVNNVNKVFLNVRKEAHAYLNANPGVLTNCNMEQIILRITSSDQVILRNTLGFEFIRSLQVIASCLTNCEEELWNSYQRNTFLKKLVMSDDLEEFNSWLTDFLIDVVGANYMEVE